MTLQRYDVAISGASLSGLALALALRATLGDGISVAVVDRPGALGVSDDPRAFAISAASFHLLHLIGVWPAVAQDAQAVTKINITAGRLESAARQTLLNWDNETAAGEAASYILPAPLLRVALVRSFQSTNIPLVEGSAGESLAVAAEGRRSPRRDLAGIKVISWAYPQSAIVTTVAHSEPHQGVATQHFLEAGPFAILPLVGGHRSSLVWTEASAEAARVMALNDADFLAALEQRFGGILGELKLAGPRISQPLELQLARSLAAARVAVIGDAARTVHPIAGQGLNLGLRDVAALTECIADTARLGLDIGSRETLERYEHWRRFDGAMSAAAMDGLNRLFSNDNPALRVLRETGLGLTDRLPGLKRMFVAEAAGLTGSVPKLLRGELP